MRLFKRKFVKFIGFSLIASIFPYSFLVASAKKVINPNLSKKQKEIMFKEGTERPYSSDLLKEKRKGFYHCANCGNKLFASTAKFDSGTGWPSFSEALPGAFTTVSGSLGFGLITPVAATITPIINTVIRSIRLI